MIYIYILNMTFLSFINDYITLGIIKEDNVYNTLLSLDNNNANNNNAKNDNPNDDISNNPDYIDKFFKNLLKENHNYNNNNNDFEIKAIDPLFLKKRFFINIRALFKQGYTLHYNTKYNKIEFIKNETLSFINNINLVYIEFLTGSDLANLYHNILKNKKPFSFSK